MPARPPTVPFAARERSLEHGEFAGLLDSQERLEEGSEATPEELRRYGPRRHDPLARRPTSTTGVAAAAALLAAASLAMWAWSSRARASSDGKASTELSLLSYKRCDRVDGVTLSSVYPCRCGELNEELCQADEVCYPGGICRLKMCSKLSPVTAVHDVYPCACATGDNEETCFAGEICDQGTCRARWEVDSHGPFPACDTDGKYMGLSSVYPCRCTGAAGVEELCQGFQKCSPTHGCEFPRCSATSGRAMSDSYPCTCKVDGDHETCDSNEACFPDGSCRPLEDEDLLVVAHPSGTSVSFTSTTTTHTTTSTTLTTSRSTTTHTTTGTSTATTTTSTTATTTSTTLTGTSTSTSTGTGTTTTSTSKSTTSTSETTTVRTTSTTTTHTPTSKPVHSSTHPPAPTVRTTSTTLTHTPTSKPVHSSTHLPAHTAATDTSTGTGTTTTSTSESTSTAAAAASNATTPSPTHGFPRCVGRSINSYGAFAHDHYPCECNEEACNDGELCEEGNCRECHVTINQMDPNGNGDIQALELGPGRYSHTILRDSHHLSDGQIASVVVHENCAATLYGGNQFDGWAAHLKPGSYSRAAPQPTVQLEGDVDYVTILDIFDKDHTGSILVHYVRGLTSAVSSEQ